MSKAPDGIEIKEVEGLVGIRPLTTHHDDRGYLYEFLRADDPEFHGFGQVYVVSNIGKPTRALHLHEEMWDWFCVVKGAAIFLFVKEVKQGGEVVEYHVQRVVVTDRVPTLISVPPTVYHGWTGLEDDAIMVAIASEPYNRENPDEKRVNPDIVGASWWEIQRR